MIAEFIVCKYLLAVLVHWLLMVITISESLLESVASFAFAGKKAR